MSDVSLEIKSKIDIVEFLKGYVTLLPAGKNYKAVCPFHKEKTPSFMVSPDRQSWHCFGSCQIGGDVFTFLMKYENIEFFEALRILAEKAGVELKRLNLAEHRQFGVLYDINNAAKDFFVKELETCEPAREYLKKRGLKIETIQEFCIGYAPNKSDALTIGLINKGFSVNDIEKSGLVFKTDRGSFVDRFRGRIMFPIFNHLGKATGFTGRILPELDTGAMGKYVNSPETAIFKKSKILYGFNKTKSAIKEAGEIFLVEGQMDFLMSWQDGVKNLASTSGTALTGEHLTAIKKYADRLVLSFDSDEAGMNAAEKAIDLAAASDLEVKIFLMPENIKDPAEIVQRQPGVLKEKILGAVPVMEFYFSRYLKEGAAKKNLRLVLAKIKNMPSPVDRSFWLKSLSSKIGFEEKTLAEEMENISAPQTSVEQGVNNPEEDSQASRAARPDSRKDLITESLLSLAVARQNLGLVEPFVSTISPVYREAFKCLKEKIEPQDAAVAAVVNLINLKAGLDLEYDPGDLAKELEAEHLKEEKLRLARSIKEAEDKGESLKLDELMRAFDEISKKIHNIKIK